MVISLLITAACGSGSAELGGGGSANPVARSGEVANDKQCLSLSGPKATLSGDQTAGFSAWKPNLIVDAWGAKWPNTDTTATGWPALVEGAANANVCWSGGEMISGINLQASYKSIKYGTAGVVHADAGMAGSSGQWATGGGPANPTFEGLFGFNAENMFSFNSPNIERWTIRNVWMMYGRDDCIENDGFWNGTVDDSFFDGCFNFMSMRMPTPKPPDTTAGLIGDHKNNTVVVKNTLIRAEPMPPDLDTPKQNMIYVNNIPYGNAGFFKGHGAHYCYGDVPDDCQGANDYNPHLILQSNIFLMETGPIEGWQYGFQVKLDRNQCKNNVLIWLGAGPYEGPQWGDDCMRIVTGQAGRGLWKQAVADWHNRHPDVGIDYKLKHPGTWTWPRTPQTEAAEFGLIGLN